MPGETVARGPDRPGGGGGLPATLGLVAVTAVWGSTFLVVKDAIATMPAMDFLAVRFVLATVAMVLVRPRAVRGLGAAGWRHGILLGLVLAAGYVTQTIGLATTPAAVSGFITGMFVVVTPVIGLLVLHRRVTMSTWTAVGLATAGLGLISLRGASISSGELLTLACAVAFAVHIVGLGEWSAGHDAYPLAVVQLGTVAVVCTSASLPGGLVLPPGGTAWAAVGITAVLATAVAFLVQTWAQARLPPTRAAVVMTMEPVFAGLFAVVLGGERLGVRTLAGASMVLAAMYLVELRPSRAAPPVPTAGAVRQEREQ
ncbi:MAG: DMT family transporter [Actinomycetes bacterium]